MIFLLLGLFFGVGMIGAGSVGVGALRAKSSPENTVSKVTQRTEAQDAGTPEANTQDAGIQDARTHDTGTEHMGTHDTGGESGGMTDHDGHDMTPINLPSSASEVEAFVNAVRTAPDMHSHDMGSAKAGEHMAALKLVPRTEATHIAIKNGDWDDPATWHNGEVPGDNAKVLVPEGVNVTYDHVSDVRIFTLRVDGKLDFATDANSQLVVDTIVISPSGHLTIGSTSDPVTGNVDIIFANNGAIDTNWDPMLLSRGMIAHGKVDIHGTEKDSHDKVIEDPRAGDTWVEFGTAPEGWEVGDTIVIAGTHYEGYYKIEANLGYSEPEDEVRVITHIENGMVMFDKPLIYDHDTPRADLKTSVANYTRNVSFETENADEAEVFERGHVMFMHNDDVDVRYAEFHELGRTDKSEPARNVDEFDQITFDSNVKGRYSFHIHKAGLDDPDNPGMAVGNAVYGSPGWGFVHHDSNAVLENNATYDTFGAGYVAESGNETGIWSDNIAIYAKGASWSVTKMVNDVANFDLGRTGDGFWFQSRMVESVDNIAASVNNGFMYFHRGTSGEMGNIAFTADDATFGELFNNDSYIKADEHPILSFSGNETFAARSGLGVVKANPNQNHDVHSVLEDFTAWSVSRGAEFEYTAHYTLIDFDIISKEATDLSGSGAKGIGFGNSISDFTIVNPTIDGFKTGIDLYKVFTGGINAPELHNYTIVNGTYLNVGTEVGNYNPALDTLLATKDVPGLTPDIEFDGPLTYSEGATAADRKIVLNGTKTDSLGKSDFPSGIDDYTIDFAKAVGTINEEGYYSTTDGQNYFLLDIYFSDRLTGDIYTEKHPVFLEGNIRLGNGFGTYGSAKFHGVRDIGSAEDTSSEVAELWATLTDGQVVLSEAALADMAEDEDVLEDI